MRVNSNTEMVRWCCKLEHENSQVMNIPLSLFALLQLLGKWQQVLFCSVWGMESNARNKFPCFSLYGCKMNTFHFHAGIQDEHIPSGLVFTQQEDAVGRPFTGMCWELEPIVARGVGEQARDWEHWHPSTVVAARPSEAGGRRCVRARQMIWSNKVRRSLVLLQSSKWKRRK